MYKHILIPSDGSDLATRALDQGLAFAKAVGARVTILTVTEPDYALMLGTDEFDSASPEYGRRAEAAAVALLGSAAAQAEALGVSVDTVKREADQPYEAIVAVAAERGCDLIAMGSHGRRGIEAIILGSQTVKVLSHSTVPVLVFR